MTALLPVIALLMLLSACTPEGQLAASETAVSKELRGKRYTEIFLIGKKSTEVYNTSGLNDSPPDKVKALDAKALAREYKVPFVFVNGPRYWVVDQITAKVGKTAKFGDLDARWVVQLKLGIDFFFQAGVTGAIPRGRCCPRHDLCVRGW